jgi:hypothetical protein
LCFLKKKKLGWPANPTFFGRGARFRNQIFFQVIQAPWITIAKPKEVVSAALGAFLTTETTFLIHIVEQYLPLGLEAWREVTLVYQRVLEEEVPTSSASWSGTLTSLLNTPLRSRLRLP